MRQKPDVPRLAVLGSGKGSNLAAIIQACRSGRLACSVVLVLSDVADAGILAKARQFNLPALHIPPGSFQTKLDEEAERLYIRRVQEAQANWVVLAGFMRVLKAKFLRAFQNRVINIHPSLLPAFPGLEAWRQAWEHGVKVTGCTVHLVDQGVDTGVIIAQEAVHVGENDTPELLHQRIQEAEHRLYPATIDALVTQRVVVQGRRSRINERGTEVASGK